VQEIIEHIITPTKEIPASHVEARGALLLIVAYRLQKVVKRVDEKRERRIVGKRITLVLI